MSINHLTKEQRKELRDALLSAFTPDTFAQMLSFGLDKTLNTLASTTASFDLVVFQVIAAAEKEGWVADLVQAAHDSNPGNPELHTFAKKVGLAYDTPPPDKLRRMLLDFAADFDLPAEMPEAERFERMLLSFSRELGLAPNTLRWESSSAVQAGSTLYRPAALTKEIDRLQHHVCCIEFRGSFATGFRVGPDMVLTSYNVAALMDSSSDAPPDFLAHFDFVADETGTLHAGRAFRLAASDWLVDFSPCSKVADVQDAHGTETLPNSDELCHALLRLDGLDDFCPTGGPDWIHIPTEPIEYPPGSSLHILGHFGGRPLELAFQPNSVIGLNRNRTRLFHRTWTEPGAGGAPYFDQDWRLIGFHVGRQPGPARTYAWGTPITAVAELLRKRGLDELFHN